MENSKSTVQSKTTENHQSFSGNTATRAMPAVPVLQKTESDEALQMESSIVQKVEVEKEPLQTKTNNTGLPNNLKSGVENLSGFSMDDVKVHYNSDKPAQLQAHAYAQGTDIHVAPGQEKHLPHEAWHVVQQKQGRVQPTMQMKEGVAVNDDRGLENEADVMGEKVLQMKPNENKRPFVASSIAQKKSDEKQNFGFLNNQFSPMMQKNEDRTKVYNDYSQSAQLNRAFIQKVSTKKKKPAKAKKGKGVLKAKKGFAKKQTMTVRNRINDYTSGRIDHLFRATGVEPGPRAEAQKVAKFLGGSWIGGHMINDQLGGNGGFKNIVPITSSMNGHHKKIENQANQLLSNGKNNEIEYKMKIQKRETIINGVKTVKELATEFHQTLDVYPKVGPNLTYDGGVLKMF